MDDFLELDLELRSEWLDQGKKLDKEYETSSDARRLCIIEDLIKINRAIRKIEKNPQIKAFLHAEALKEYELFKK